MGALEDDLTEHHRMRTIEDLRKDFLEIEALRKELAEAKAALEVYDRTFPKKSELELHAALEAPNARIAELEAENADLRRWKALDKPLTTAMSVASSSINEHRARAERAEAALKHEADCVEAAKARIAELEDERAAYIPRELYVTARAERAEARIAELADKGTLQALRDANDRAERAEAEADSLRATIDNMRAMNIKLTMEATGQVLAAEAECRAMREGLAFYAYAQRFATGTERHRRALGEADAFRAALNPSEREG